MRTSISFIAAFMICFALNGQTPDSLKNESNPDTTNIMLGKKEIRIVDKDGETDIKVTNRDKAEKHEETNEEIVEDNSSGDNESYSNEGNNRWERRNSDKHFKGHWDAFQLGINSYLSADKSTSLPAADDYMSLNTNKSINVNFNMFQQSFGLIGKNFGLLTGLGFEFTNYVFDGNNTIDKNASGEIISVDPGYKLDKSKLVTTYLTVPLLLEFQFPGEKRSNRLYMNAGVVGGIKLGAHTKIKYKENGDKQNKKNRNDFNLNALRYGFTGRVGIKHLSLYGTYYPVTLFEKHKGPELYPFMVGFSFDGF